MPPYTAMKRILILIDWFYPAFKAGGPIQSCKNIVDTLSDKYSFYLLTSDRDLGDKMPLKGIIPDQWVDQNDNTHIRYTSKDAMTGDLIKQVIEEVKPDIIYLNSLFSLRYTLIPFYILNKIGYNGKIIIAPRGMLHQGAMQYKTFKKKLFLYLFSRFYVRQNVFFHATDEQEALDIKKYFGHQSQVLVVENIPSIDYSPLQSKPKEKKSIKCVYASRLHPKKNLLFALEVLKDLEDANIQFDIYGPIDDKEYLMECLDIAYDLPANVMVNFCRPLRHFDLSQKLKEYHLFFLPTRGENFGHVIFEAMSAGLPVLISDQTPWTNVEAYEAGWSLPLANKESFAEKIRMVCDMDSEAFRSMANNAKEYANTYYGRLNFKQKYGELFG